LSTPRDEYVRRILSESREEVSRADTKASTVLAGAGIVVGIVLTGLVTGDVSLAGSRWYVGTIACAGGASLLAGVALLGAAVYPRTGQPADGHARWFAEIERYKDDDTGLLAAIETDRNDGMRDLHQAVNLSEIVVKKYTLTKVGMWLLAVGLVLAGGAALLHVWKR
jgi:hypothetical protein